MVYPLDVEILIILHLEEKMPTLEAPGEYVLTPTIHLCHWNSRVGEKHIRVLGSDLVALVDLMQFTHGLSS